MSKPYVNSYNKAFLKAFSYGLTRMPDTTKLKKEIVDNVFQDIVHQVEGYISDQMAMNLDDMIREKAREVAESMLMNAIAGDDKDIKNLFGFDDWYMKHSYIGSMPTQWKLIDALMERKPELFTNEKIAQQKSQIDLLEKELARVTEYKNRLLEEIR